MGMLDETGVAACRDLSARYRFLNVCKMFVRPESRCIVSGSTHAIRFTDRRDAKLRDKSLPECSSDPLFRRQSCRRPRRYSDNFALAVAMVSTSSAIVAKSFPRNRHVKLVLPQVGVNAIAGGWRLLELDGNRAAIIRHLSFWLA